MKVVVTHEAVREREKEKRSWIKANSKKCVADAFRKSESGQSNKSPTFIAGHATADVSASFVVGELPVKDRSDVDRQLVDGGRVV